MCLYLGICLKMKKTVKWKMKEVKMGKENYCNNIHIKRTKGKIVTFSKVKIKPLENVCYAIMNYFFSL